MRAALLLLLLPLLSGCDERRGRQPWDGCTELCRELVSICSFDAYPDFDSCEAGCVYEDERGSDMNELAECVEDADCDTFEIVACQREHGSED